MNGSSDKCPNEKWLIRVPAVFAEMEPEVLRELGARCLRKLGRDFMLIELCEPRRIVESAAAKFIPWNLPVQHMWPCRPLEIRGFIEKAAQAMAGKFAVGGVQTVMVGALDADAAKRGYRALASNLRGRALQLFPIEGGNIRDAEEQDSRAPSLFALVGEEGLFCGVAAPLAANGFHPGGIRYIKQNAPGAISRAGAKIASALHHLRLHQPLPADGAHWLELGASPGGMTAELLARGYRVTAVDRAPLDPRLNHAGGLRFVLADAGAYEPQDGERFDALLSDMNGDARAAMRTVCRHATALKPRGVVVFTLKTPGTESFGDIQVLTEEVLEIARNQGLEIVSLTHLEYNRHEFTLIARNRNQGRSE